MKKVVLGLVFLIFFMCLRASFQNPDTPVKGDWDFKLKKMWEVSRVGEEVIGHPLQVLVTEKGHVVVHDVKFKTNRLFSPDGQYITSFGQKGEGPGEIKNQDWMYAVGDKVAVPDGSRVHFFNQDGSYHQSLPKPFGLNIIGFLNEYEVISAPLTVFQMTGGRAKISIYNLQSRKEKVVSEFSVFEGGVGQNGDQVYDVVMRSLSPMMIVGFYLNKFYYGMNSAYTIQIADLQGKKTGQFAVERKKRPVSRSEIRDRFQDSRMPDNAVKQIVDSLPDEIASFERIEGHQGLIYVFVADLEHWKDRDWQPKQIDIFSPGGRYLYRSFLRFADGAHLFNTPFSNLVIRDGHLVAALEDSDGEVKLVKYRVELPGAER